MVARVMFLETPERSSRTHDDRRRAGPFRRGLPDEATRGQIYRHWSKGASIDVLAEQFSLATVVVERVVNENRIRRILEQDLKFVYHSSFEEAAAHDVILAPMPAPDGRLQPRGRPPVELPTSLEFLRIEAPLLTREQEAHLFRKMNYLKFCASKIRSRLEPPQVKLADVVQIERLLGEVTAVKNRIIGANLRLVIAIARKYVDKAHSLFELVSDGNMSLIHAVDKFDYSRGFKFSTYASWAILNNFARSLSLERRRRDRFPTGFEELSAIAEFRASGFERESDGRRYGEVVHAMLGRLSDRERRILVGRFGLGGTGKQTLGQIGSELGITKERVRQIEMKAKQKLYKFALKLKIDPQAF